MVQQFLIFFETSKLLRETLHVAAAAKIKRKKELQEDLAFSQEKEVEGKLHPKKRGPGKKCACPTAAKMRGRRGGGEIAEGGGGENRPLSESS